MADSRVLAWATECLLQPIRFAISKRGEEWRGRIEYHLYYGQPDPERAGGWAYEVDFLSLVGLSKAMTPKYDGLPALRNCAGWGA